MMMDVFQIQGVRVNTHLSRHIVVQLLLGWGLVVAPGCASTSSSDTPDERKPAAQQSSQAAPHDNLNATLWVQTSAEYRSLTRQAYAAARHQLDRALDDESRVAAPEQSSDTAADKPPAVVLDVDETVLDNSAYQASLIDQRESFSVESWNAWCRRAEADPIPGAVEFARYADRQDVTVFYVTNREHEVEAPTRDNLKRHGFPIDDERDVLMTKYERETWEGSKVPRRRSIARDFRITLLIGDSLGDFVSVPEGSSPEARRQIIDNHQKRWGRDWIVLPNPTYGDWESSLYNYDYQLPTGDKRQQKLDTLETPKAR